MINNFLLAFVYLLSFFNNSVNANESDDKPSFSDFNESRNISEIYTQGDFDFWLLGYQIILDDGSSWFTERGPLDYWDWEVGDEVKIETYSTQDERKLLLPGFDYTSHRIMNITRNDLDDFRFDSE